MAEAGEIGLDAGELRASEIYFVELAVWESSGSQVAVAECDASELGAFEVGFAEIAVFERHVAKVCAVERGQVELGGNGGRVQPFRIDELDAGRAAAGEVDRVD